MYILASMSKIYILLEELSHINSTIDYNIIGIYLDKQSAIDNSYILYKKYLHTNTSYKPFYKVLEYPINTPLDFISNCNNNTILELGEID
jgi:hypothetical protein